MKFSDFSQYIERIEKTASRLTITTVLAELFNKLQAEELHNAVYLLQGRVAPLFTKIESGMAEKMVIKSVMSAMQLEKKRFDEEYKKVGDIGVAVEALKKKNPSLLSRNLSVNDVYKHLYDLANASGEGSQDSKINILADLIRYLDPLSARYVVRIPMGVMRLGFSDMTILDAFSWMLSGGKNLRPSIEHAYHVRPDLGYIGQALKEKHEQGLKHIRPEIFTPILMMRAERLSSAPEIIDKIGECIVEPKYDGFRLQVHYDRKEKKVRLYSRNLEDVTFMYPDIVQGICSEITADTVICEGEAIGYDPIKGTYLPFQETVQRKRKYDIDQKAKEIPLRLFLFEIIYLNGDSLLRTPLSTRREKLEHIISKKISKKNNVVVVAPAEKISKPILLEEFFEDAIGKNLEGIIAKKLDGIYQPGARGWNWIKYKKSYSSKINDTLDCLVMGYDLGKGKRTQFGIGAFLVGVLDEQDGTIKTIAKIGTGLTDEEWRDLHKRAGSVRTAKKPALYDVDQMMSCDVWVSPKIVVEIKADEITRSPVHTAGRIMQRKEEGKASIIKESGYALRFPRLERFRSDKRSDDVTTITEVKEMFQLQKKQNK